MTTVNNMEKIVLPSICMLSVVFCASLRQNNELKEYHKRTYNDTEKSTTALFRGLEVKTTDADSTPDTDMDTDDETIQALIKIEPAYIPMKYASRGPINEVMTKPVEFSSKLSVPTLPSLNLSLLSPTKQMPVSTPMKIPRLSEIKPVKIDEMLPTVSPFESFPTVLPDKKLMFVEPKQQRKRVAKYWFGQSPRSNVVSAPYLVPNYVWSYPIHNVPVFMPIASPSGKVATNDFVFDYYTRDKDLRKLGVSPSDFHRFHTRVQQNVQQNAQPINSQQVARGSTQFSEGNQECEPESSDVRCSPRDFLEDSTIKPASANRLNKHQGLTLVGRIESATTTSSKEGMGIREVSENALYIS